jgi:aspartate aminotransferase/aminotransferase
MKQGVMAMAGFQFPNSRMSDIPLSGGIREIFSRANELERQGKRIIHMEIGRPDFDSPESAKAGVREALEKGDVHYTDMSGTIDLRQAIARKYREENNMDVDAERHVIVTAGAIEALIVAFLTILERGDEVVVPSPFFPAYADQVALANSRLVKVPCCIQHDFRLRAEDLEKVLTPRTKLLLINTPNNPTGAVLSLRDLEDISSLAQERNFWVVSDECYEKFLYEGEHVSIASLPGMADRSVTIGAASKTWSMTGWRVGWLISPSEMKPYAAKCHQNLTTCGNSFAQAGVARAFREAGSNVASMVAEYKRRREMVCMYLDLLGEVETVRPKGAFYVFPSIGQLGMSSREFCKYLLEEWGVSSVPGDAFGAEGFIRLAYCRSYEDVEEGMTRFCKAVTVLGRRKS